MWLGEWAPERRQAGGRFGQCHPCGGQDRGQVGGRRWVSRLSMGSPFGTCLMALGIGDWGFGGLQGGEDGGLGEGRSVVNASQWHGWHLSVVAFAV